MSSKKSLSLAVATILSIGFIGCGGGGGGDSSTQPTSTAISFEGKVQKGPYESGTVLTIKELDKNLNQTGASYTTEVMDNFGDYQFSGKLKNTIVEIFANGYYYDEIANQTSTSQLQLSVLVNLKDKKNININLLSSLIKPRVQTLMSEGKTFVEAKQQSEQEVLKVFNIVSSNSSFEDLDMSSNNVNSEILLAVSSILLQAATTKANENGSIPGILSIILTNLKNDIKDNGVLDSQTLKNEISDASKVVSTNIIKVNLENRFSYSVPDFGLYIDKDQDGFLAKDDDNTPNDINLSLNTLVLNNEYITNEINISGLTDNSFAELVTYETGSKNDTNESNITTSIIKNGVQTNSSKTTVSNEDIVQIKIKVPKQFNLSKEVQIRIGTLEKNITVQNEKIIQLSNLNVEFEANDNGSKYINNIALSSDGTKAFVAYANGLKIVDVSNPKSPSIIGAYIRSRGFYHVKLSPDETKVYVTSAYYGMGIIDVTDPTQPTLLGQYTSNIGGSGYVDLSKDGSIAYLAERGNGLQIINVSDSTNPVVLGKYSISDSPNYGFGKVIVSSDGNKTYIQDYSNGLKVIDVHNPKSPSLLGQYDIGQTDDMEKSGDVIYLKNGSKLYVLNVSQAISPSLTKEIEMSGQYIAVSSDKTKMYSSPFNEYNISNPLLPELITSGDRTTITLFKALLSDNTLFYIGTYNEGMKIYRKE